MGLLETLVMGVGAGVAKGILKVWFKADPVSAGFRNSLLEIITSKTSDADEQKKAEEQFEQVAKMAAQSIQDTITTKYPNIPEDRKVVIANSAGETVNTTPFSAELLARSNISPDALLVLLLKKLGAERGHPDLRDKGAHPAAREEFDAYHAILSEAAQLIVDGALQYPNYTPAVFSELLQGQDKHVQKFDRILGELKHIQQGRRGEDSAYDDFDQKYRRAVVRQLDELQIFGVDLAAATKRYKLSTAYVSLHVGREAVHGNNQSRKKQDEEYDATESVRVEEALAQTSRLFIRGGAGSGKTTLLQWIAVMSAARNLKDELAEWNDYIPFFIRVRDFARKDLPSPDDFASLISETLESAPAGWARNQLQSGRAIVLIDGVDELPADRTDSVRKWLNDLIFDFADARYVLSSRPHAELELKGFFDAELREMNSTDIASFIAHWHDAAREGLEDPEKTTEVTELEKTLTQRIQNTTAIHKVATSPLLCTVICALHLDRMRNVPEDRIELCEACIEMFLRRDNERRIEFPQHPNLSSRQIKALLSDLAYWYMRDGVSLADVKGVDGRFQKKLRGFKNLPEGTNGTLVRRGLVARSGILREPSSGKIEFSHRTFQEFFAAKEIADQRDFGVLVKNADDQQNWRETIILAAGLANQLEAEDLIEKLLKRFDKTSDVGVLLLAVGCLETTVTMTDLVKKMLEERLQAILPPKNTAEAMSFASAGDLAVPFLSGVDKMTGTTAAASVTALVMIGTDAAFEVLRRVWKEETRVGVWKRLINSAHQWPNPDKYLHAVIPPIADIRYEHRGMSWVTIGDGRQFPSHKLPLEFLMRVVREQRVERVVVFEGGRPEVLSQLRASGYEPVESTDTWTVWCPSRST